MRNLSITCLFLILYTNMVFAVGVPVNTSINNMATLDYQIGGTPFSVNASSSFSIEERLEAAVTWLDAANVSSVSPSAAAVASYRVTNIGNGIEQYLLSVNGIVGGDDFDIAAPSLQIWIDNGNSVWESGLDTLYTGANGPILDANVIGNDSVVIFVVATIPAGLTPSDIGIVELTATSMTADTGGVAGVEGSQLPANGDGGSIAIVGTSGAQATAQARYEIVSGAVAITKSVTIIDTQGGNSPETGATLRYSLSVQVGGATPVGNLVVTDPIPVNTTYTPNSITLNSVAQSDAADAPIDFADFNISNLNTVTVDLSQGGAVNIAPPAIFTITFEVTIN